MVTLKNNGQLIEINGDGYPSDRLRYRRLGNKLSIVYMENTVVVPFVDYDQFEIDDTPAASVNDLLDWIGENFKPASGSAGSTGWAVVTASTDYTLSNADHKKVIEIDADSITAPTSLNIGMEFVIRNTKSKGAVLILGDYVWGKGQVIYSQFDEGMVARCIVMANDRIFVEF